MPYLEWSRAWHGPVTERKPSVKSAQCFPAVDVRDKIGWRGARILREDVDLSDREREVLGLLLQGHEIKSIAAMLGFSVHAVNERLRDARRKLGASSSREAARRYFGGQTPSLSGTRIPGLARHAPDA